MNSERKKTMLGGAAVKVGVVGSRSLHIENIGAYLPAGTTELISGGARGVDRSAREWARRNGMPITEFLPDYDAYGRRAPLRRNEQIAACCDALLAFWDGKSQGTLHTVSACQRLGKPVTLIRVGADRKAYKVTFLPEQTKFDLE